jgi:uncharacterized protein (DUF1501 family)
MLTRRQFLGSGAGMSAVALGGALPGLFVRAADDAAKAGRTDRVLVVVELTGGNDGLNTVIPFEDDLYHKARPTLHIAKDQVQKLTDHVGLHPSMEAAAELFKNGRLTVVQGVGYPEPDRSHFRSMEIWQTASTAKRAPSTGWLGRVLDATTKEGDEEAFAAGLVLTDSLPQAFLADRVSVPVVKLIDNFNTGVADTPDADPIRARLLRKLSTGPTVKGEPIPFLRSQAEIAYRTAAKLREAAANYQSNVDYPGDLGAQLRRAAQVIAANLGVRLIWVSQGGYDTHSKQGPAHQGLLGELSGALAAFQKDLDKLKLVDRVLVMTFSEFGRRVDENASQGTDHGAASCLFLCGSKVKGGLAGTYPSLAKLGEGDLIHTVDFRAVYATLLEKWLGCDVEKVLGEKIKPLDFLKA